MVEAGVGIRDVGSNSDHVAGFVIISVVSAFKDVPLRWWLISIGGPSAFGIVLAILIGTATCVGINRRARSGGA